MASPWIERLCSVALQVGDLGRAQDFYTHVWGLEVARRDERSLYLRGTGGDPYLLAFQVGDSSQASPAIRHVTLRAHSVDALGSVARACIAAGGSIHRPIHDIDDPGGGEGLILRDPWGRLFQIVHGDAQLAEPDAISLDRPQRLAHVVLNARELDASQRFLEQVLGFRLADRTAAMAFMNCNADHHTLALGATDNDALNHIAFLMPDIDSVMRGGARMRDAGFPIEWGPGRHGPGANVFNYFIGPFGEVIEYTSEIEQIDDTYRARSPTDWAWPPGRTDRWGLSPAPSARIKQAQREVFFTPTGPSP
jgi:catechol 2,3-dioxygenase-like lactoylglutathione lyase family enzyme